MPPNTPAPDFHSQADIPRLTREDIQAAVAKKFDELLGCAHPFVSNKQDLPWCNMCGSYFVNSQWFAPALVEDLRRLSELLAELKKRIAP